MLSWSISRNGVCYSTKEMTSSDHMFRHRESENTLLKFVDYYINSNFFTCLTFLDFYNDITDSMLSEI